MIVGTEWLVEAAGCKPTTLRDERILRGLFERIISDLGLKAVGSVWHKFPGEGGITGLVALTESHLACHTYPEYGTATFNLYCCRTRPEWNWQQQLTDALGAARVTVTKIERGQAESRISNQSFENKSGIASLRSEISNVKSEISNLKSETGMPTSSFETESEISNLKFEIAGGEA